MIVISIASANVFLAHFDIIVVAFVITFAIIAVTIVLVVAIAVVAVTGVTVADSNDMCRVELCAEVCCLQ